jgi:hypothetical protein
MTRIKKIKLWQFAIRFSQNGEYWYKPTVIILIH